VEEAYFDLRGTEIPIFVENLKKQSECLIREELIKSIHQFGINIRYIGFLRSHIHEQIIVKAHLLAEMIIRVTKNYIRHSFPLLHFIQYKFFDSLIIRYVIQKKLKILLFLIHTHSHSSTHSYSFFL
jgi:hypothetical protein